MHVAFFFFFSKSSSARNLSCNPYLPWSQGLCWKPHSFHSGHFFRVCNGEILCPNFWGKVKGHLLVAKAMSCLIQGIGFATGKESSRN